MSDDVTQEARHASRRSTLGQWGGQARNSDGRLLEICSPVS